MYDYVDNGGVFHNTLKDGEDELGYKFNILLDPDTVPEVAREILIMKIKKGINRRHLKKRGDSWKIGAKDVLRGRIESNDDFSDTEFERVFVIDGKRQP